MIVSGIALSFQQRVCMKSSNSEVSTFVKSFESIPLINFTYYITHKISDPIELDSIEQHDFLQQ